MEACIGFYVHVCQAVFPYLKNGWGNLLLALNVEALTHGWVLVQVQAMKRVS
jgi:hypothetical protein